MSEEMTHNSYIVAPLKAKLKGCNDIVHKWQYDSAITLMVVFIEI